MGKDNNPVVEIYKGVPIRKYPVVKIYVDTISLKQIIDTQQDTGLSVKKILAYSSRPCSCCTGVNVIILKKDGKEIEIPRGIISKRIGNASGKKRIIKL